MRYIGYICGPYTAKTIEQRDRNVAAANEAGKDLLAKGYAVIVPHTMSVGWEFDPRFKHADFMASDLALLEHCDLLIMLPGWQHSVGSQQEITWARENGIPTYAGTEVVPDADCFEPDCTTELIADLYERRRKGVHAYGVPLRPFNGRDAKQDKREELMDLLLYDKQEQMESRSAFKAGVLPQPD